MAIPTRPTTFDEASRSACRLSARSDSAPILDPSTTFTTATARFITRTTMRTRVTPRSRARLGSPAAGWFTADTMVHPRASGYLLARERNARPDGFILESLATARRGRERNARPKTPLCARGSGAYSREARLVVHQPTQGVTR